MYRLLAIVCLFALSLGAAAAEKHAAKHSSHTRDPDWYASIAIANSAGVDFGAQCDLKPDGDHAFLEKFECRRVHAAAIVKALKSAGPAAKSAGRVVLDGLIIDGVFDLHAAKLPFGLEFKSVTFLGVVKLDEASLDGDLRFENAIFLDGISAGSLHAGGTASFKKIKVQRGDIDFSSSQISGDVRFADCEFETGPMLSFRDASLVGFTLTGNKDPLSLDMSRAQITGSLRIAGDAASIAEAKLGGINVAKEVQISGVAFTRGLSLDAVKIGGDLSLENHASVSGKVLNLRDATVKGRLRLTDATISEKLDANSLSAARIDIDKSTFEKHVILSLCQVVGDVSIKNSSVAKLTAQKADIRGSFYFDSSSGEMSGLDLSAAKVGGDFFVRGSTIVQPVTLSQLSVGKIFGLENGAEIKGGIQLNGAKVEGDLHIGEEPGALVTIAGDPNLSLIHVLGNVFIHRAVFTTAPSFIGAIIENHLDIAGAVLPGLDLTRSQIKGDFRVASLKQKRSASWVPRQGSKLDLRFARIGFMQDDAGTLEADPWPVALELEGLAFDHFGTRRSVEWIKGWLDRNVYSGDKAPTQSAKASNEDDTSFQQQPYAQIGKHFLDAGDKESSDAVLFAAKDREALTYWHMCADFNLNACNRAIWSGLLRNLIGYGIGNGIFWVFYWVVFFTLVCALVLKFSSLKDGRKNPWGGKNALWCMGASLSHLIPLVDLNKEFKDHFDDPARDRLRSWQLVYFGLHAMLGYLLATFVAAAVAGLTQGH